MHKNIIFKAVARVVIFLSVLELLLRMGGWVFISAQSLSNRFILKGDKGVFCILCVGDSFTIGANSYPVRLEETLNRSRNGLKFKVIKEGVSSATTSYISTQLDQWLQDYRPDMLLVLAGVNDDRFYKNRVDLPKQFVRINSYALHLMVGLSHQLQEFLTQKASRLPHPENVRDEQEEMAKKILDAT